MFGKTSNEDRWVDAIEAWAVWMRAGRRSENTIELRRYQLMRFAEHHLTRSPWRIDTTELVEWLGSRGWSVETMRSYRAALRGFFWWARVSKRRRDDPSETLPTIAQPVTAPRPTPDGILDDALARADDRSRLILMCAAYAGMRCGEIAQLRWADIGDTHIRVHGKGGHIRSVPIHAKLDAAFCVERALRRAGTAGTGYRFRRGLLEYVFPGQCGGPMTPEALSKIASRALGPGWTGHTLRHRAATRAYAGSRDLLAVQELLGHKKPETTRRYTQTPADAVSAAVASI